MQIAGTSNDDPMPRAQIDGAPIFLSSSPPFRPAAAFPYSSSLPPSSLSRASSSFGVPAILSRYELARAFGCKVSRITLPKESPPTVLHRRGVHFYREFEKKRRGEARGKSSCRRALKRDGEFPLISKQSRHNKLVSRDSK